MKLKMFIFLSALLPMIALGDTKAVLSTDTNHDGKVNAVTINNGEDLILVKKNPPVLSATDVVLQTKGYNLYTAATLNDLTPGAERKLFFAKLLPNGFIKIYTLANVGYSNIEVSPDNKDIFLVTFKNVQDKVQQIQIEPPSIQAYNPTLKTKKSIQGR